MYLSYQLDIASGAAIVLLAAAVFTIVFTVTSGVKALSGRQGAAAPALSPAPLTTAPALDGHLFD